MSQLVEILRKIARDESGISSVEYTLILALVAGGIVAAAIALGVSVAGEFNEATACMQLQLCD